MIGQIENAIVNRIRGFSEAENMPLGYRFKTLSTAPDDWPEYLSKNLNVTACPAVWVTYGGGRQESQTASQVDVQEVFGVVVAAKNARNEQATRHGVANEVGSYQLTSDIIEILAGNNLNLPIGELKLVSRTPVPMPRGVIFSLFAIQFQTEVSYPVRFDEPDGNFEILATEWCPPLSVSQVDGIGEIIEPIDTTDFNKPYGDDFE